MVTKRKIKKARISKSARLFFFGIIREKDKVVTAKIKILVKIAILLGKFGCRRKIIKGRVTKRAVTSEAKRVEETTIGIGLMNSPIIPLERSKGKKAQTVVIVVVKTGVRKSCQTKSPASIGVNFPERE